ncbi:MAG: hypothetical protein JXR41_00210 [Bacteroidales bacterium]|nr:hypothetical protein [Bacteroidales bacterium]
MEKVLSLLALVLIVTGLFPPQQAGAQAPDKMSYQAVIRNSSSELVVSSTVGMQISIRQGTAEGTAVYTETQTPTTNANGLVSLEIGTGTTSDDFSAIDWSAGPYFIKTEIATEEPFTTYTITGTSQLLSVPYALHSGTSDVLIGEITESQISDLGSYIETETDPSVPSGTQTGEMQYWDGSEWITVTAGNEGQVLTFTGGVPTWTTTVGANDVQNPTTGAIWMDRNLGASQVATSSTDAASYGDLYQWGRAAEGHESRTSTTTSTNATTAIPNNGNSWDGLFITETNSPHDWLTSQDNTLWQGVSGTNNPCPSGYRLPTETELEAERLSWISNDAAGAFASPLKLPVAGYHYESDGLLNHVGSRGFYWSSTVDGNYSRYFLFEGSNAVMAGGYRASGMSVRCLKD